MKHPGELDRHLGRRLRQRRWFVGLTQEQLARKIGVAPQQIDKYEQGRNRMAASRLHDLACVLDVAPGYFYWGAPEPGDELVRLLADREAHEFLGMLHRLPAERREASIAMLHAMAGREDKERQE